jgi:hypothetical protein
LPPCCNIVSLGAVIRIEFGLQKNLDGLQTFPPEFPSIHCSDYVVDSAIQNNLAAAADSASYPLQESAPLKLQRSQMSHCWNVHCFADCDLSHLQGIDQPKPLIHPGYFVHCSGYDLSYPRGTDQLTPRVHPDYYVSCPLLALDSVETTNCRKRSASHCLFLTHIKHTVISLS